MSKDSSSSGKLLGTIKFVFDVTKSRNLNATQAYDVSTSQIVLASYPATSTIKTPAKSLASNVQGIGIDLDNFLAGNVTVTGTNWNNESYIIEAGVSMLGGLRTGKEESSAIPPSKGIVMSFNPIGKEGQAGLKNSSGATLVPGTQQSTASFAGFLLPVNSVITPNTDDPTGTKSNATKDIFSGNILLELDFIKRGKISMLF